MSQEGAVTASARTIKNNPQLAVPGLHLGLCCGIGGVVISEISPMGWLFFKHAKSPTRPTFLVACCVHRTRRRFNPFSSSSSSSSCDPSRPHWHRCHRRAGSSCSTCDRHRFHHRTRPICQSLTQANHARIRALKQTGQHTNGQRSRARTE